VRRVLQPAFLELFAEHPGKLHAAAVDAVLLRDEDRMALETVAVGELLAAKIPILQEAVRD
jgi:hypothetical protein